MKKMIITLLMAVLSLSIIAQTTKTQVKPVLQTTETEVKTFVPQIAYQGLVKDSKGTVLANGKYEVEFKLYNAAEKGEMVWTEKQDIQIEDGVINAVLGQSAKVDLPFDQQYWLSLTVNKEEMPRQLLTASPYVAGNSVKSINGATGNVEIVGGNGVSVQKGKDGQIVIEGNGSAATGDGSKADGWTQSGTITYTSNNIGIGVSLPTDKLTVGGNITATGKLSANLITSNSTSPNGFGVWNNGAFEQRLAMTVAGINPNKTASAWTCFDKLIMGPVIDKSLFDHTKSSAPYEIAFHNNGNSSNPNNFNHELMFYNEDLFAGQPLRLDMRLCDGDLMFGFDKTPNATIYNNGNITTANGTVTAKKFIGDGSELTHLPVTSSQWSGNASNISYSGNVGIGSFDNNNKPQAKLDVAGTIKAGGSVLLYENYSTDKKEKIGFSVAPSELQIYGGGTGSNHISFGKYDTKFTPQMVLTQNGSLGIGTVGEPTAKLDVNGDAKVSGGIRANAYLDLNGKPIQTSQWNDIPTNGIKFDKGSSTKVLIGCSSISQADTDVKNAMFVVNGGIAATSIVVNTNIAGGKEGDGKAWPDYVFSPDYKMMSLDQVEDFIETNNHLPGVPSATEIGKKGINIGDMQRIYMEKIEELTLHLIEQGKEIKALKKQLKGRK